MYIYFVIATLKSINDASVLPCKETIVVDLQVYMSIFSVFHLVIFYIHGSVHRNSILIRSNKLQQYAGIYLLKNHSLHVSDFHRTRHQEYIKL